MGALNVPRPSSITQLRPASLQNYQILSTIYEILSTLLLCMKQAVIKTGGKQHLVTEGAQLKVEKLLTDEGKNITFDEVLLIADGDTITIGKPTVANAKVEGKVLQQGRHPKVTGVRMKAKKRQRVYFGHKQHFTKVEITKISA